MSSTPLSFCSTWKVNTLLHVLWCHGVNWDSEVWHRMPNKKKTRSLCSIISGSKYLSSEWKTMNIRVLLAMCWGISCHLLCSYVQVQMCLTYNYFRWSLVFIRREFSTPASSSTSPPSTPTKPSSTSSTSEAHCEVANLNSAHYTCFETCGRGWASPISPIDNIPSQRKVYDWELKYINSRVL